MVKFIKVNDIPTHEVLIIPIASMVKIQTNLVGQTDIVYRTEDAGLDRCQISHAAMPSASDTAMTDWLTRQFIAANQRPWSEPMYNVSASDAPYSISDIQIA